MEADVRSNLLRWVALAIAVLAPLASCDENSPTEPAPVPCAYALSTLSLSFSASGGSDSVTVTTTSQCTWTAVSDRAWMSIVNGASGTGTGTVNVSVSPNPGDSVRTGTLAIAGQVVTVRVDGLAPCTIDISPGSASFTSDGGSGSVAVTAPAHCQWSAASNATWLAVMSGVQGSGSGSVSYSVD